MKRNFGLWAIVVLVAGFALTNCTKPGTEGAESKTEAPAKGAPAGVKLEAYVMSQCPYGVQALDAIIPAVEKFDGSVELVIDYIGKDENGQLQSMHGANELAGNIAQLCVKKIAPQAHLKFISCVNKEWKSIPGNTESCAKELGIDLAALSTCKDGAEGQELMRASFARAAAVGAQGSPTLKINGQDYQGGRGANDFVRGLCGVFDQAAAPKLCAELPAPPKVEVIGITDKRCPKCDVEQVIGSLKTPFPGLSARIIDYSEPEAKEIMAAGEIKLLPALLFNDSIKLDPEGEGKVGRFLVPAGAYKSLRIGAEFDPAAEICDNKIDDTNNGKVDCADDTCKEAMACRSDKPNHLDLFVMSQCPYGVLGLDAMKEIFDAFGDEISFGVHFIASEMNGQFQALHGQPEVDENIRELCAIKHYPKDNKYMDYIWCRNKNIRSPEWKECTGENGIKTATIEKCFSGPEGKRLLSEDIKLAQALKVGGSPTWMVNNRHIFNGIAAADIQKNLCEHNKDLKGCAKTIAAPQPQGGAPAPAAAGSCGG